MRTYPVPVFLLLVPAAAVADGPGITVAPIAPPAFRLLAEPAVQKELALTGAQQAALDRIRRTWDVPAEGLKFGVGHIPADALREAVTQQANDFLKKDLTKEQRARLDQIGFQLREREFGPHQAFVMSARDLGLRPDQLDDVRTLKGLRVDEIARAVTSGKRYEKVKADVSATNGETFEKMAEMLTRTQRERLKELRGKAFDGKVDVAIPPPVATKAQYPAPKFGLYDLELAYLWGGEVRAELGLSADQDRRINSDELRGYWGRGGKIVVGSEEKVHELTEKALADVLTAEQRRRFDQLMMQRRARISLEAVCSHPAAVAALKLTPIQLRDLAAGKSLVDVLSRDQLDKYGKLLGEAFDRLRIVNDGYVPILDPGFSPGVTHAQARDFLRFTDRLGLTEDQVKKLRDLAEDEPRVRELIQKELSLDNTPPVAGASRSLTAVNAVTQMYREAVEKQCWDVLDPQQQSTAKKIFGRGRK